MQSQPPGSEPPGPTPAKRRQKRPAGHDDDERRRKMQASSTTNIRGLLREFLEQQLRLDLQRHEMMERHARQRAFFEQQWRQSMHSMERERLVLEREWMEREEQRRAREEDRAQRRDALFTNLLTSLLHGDL